jgi:hypothetical protein
MDEETQMLTNEQFYAAANLKDNPFRDNPVGDADPRRGIWVGYPRQKVALTKHLERSRADQVGNLNFLLIFGELGVGKSHALLWSQYQVLHERKTEFDSVAYYIQTLQRDKGKVSFGAAFQDDVVDKSNLVNDLLSYRQFVGECFIEFKRENGFGTDVTNERVAELMVPSLDMRNTLREILKCEDQTSARAFLTPDGDYAAMLLFCRLTNLFVYPYGLKSGARRFRKCVYLLIDELDILADVSTKEARDANALIRHIYDLCPNCFFLGLGFTATSAELNILFEGYIIDRVTRQIVLDFLQPDEAKDFVRQILNSARVDTKKKIDYFPFTEEAVVSIVSQIVSITPRKIVKQMQQIIEECRLVGINPSKELITTAMLDAKQIWEMIS